MFTLILLLPCLCWHIVTFVCTSLPPAGDQWNSMQPHVLHKHSEDLNIIYNYNYNNYNIAL